MVIFHSYVTVYQRVSAISSYDSWGELTVADDSCSEPPARQATIYYGSSPITRDQFVIWWVYIQHYLGKPTMIYGIIWGYMGICELNKVKIT
jgi:hypothetical protein